jgi:hypothetical protein
MLRSIGHFATSGSIGDVNGDGLNDIALGEQFVLIVQSINTSTHQHLTTQSSHQHNHQHINTSTHQHINT